MLLDIYTHAILILYFIIVVYQNFNRLSFLFSSLAYEIEISLWIRIIYTMMYIVFSMFKSVLKTFNKF